MSNLKEFGAKIKARRIELNMTQDELAKAAGYTSRSTINKIELGLVDVSQSKIAILAKALKTSPTFLVGWGDTYYNNATQHNIDKLLPNIELKDNLIVSIGRDGQRTIYEISDEDAAIVDAFLNKFKKG